MHAVTDRLHSMHLLKEKASCMSLGRKEAMIDKGRFTGSWKGRCQQRLKIWLCLRFRSCTQRTFYCAIYFQEYIAWWITVIFGLLGLWRLHNLLQICTATHSHKQVGTDLCKHNALMCTSEHVFSKFLSFRGRCYSILMIFNSKEKQAVKDESCLHHRDVHLSVVKECLLNGLETQVLKGSNTGPTLAANSRIL